MLNSKRGRISFPLAFFMYLSCYKTLNVNEDPSKLQQEESKLFILSKYH